MNRTPVVGVCPGAHLVPPQVNHLGRCPSSWFWPHFQGVRAKCAGVQSSPWVFYLWEGETSWPLRGGSCCPGPLQGNSRCRQARNAGRFKHCPCTAGCTAQPHPHPRDRELGAALTPNPCSQAGSPLTFSLGGGPSMLLLSSQGGPGRPRLGGLCLPARLPLPFSALAALAARQSHCPPGHTLYGVGGWIPGQAAFERSGFPVVSKTLQLSFCRDLEIANISFLKGQRSRFFGMLKKSLNCVREPSLQ